MRYSSFIAPYRILSHVIAALSHLVRSCAQLCYAYRKSINQPLATSKITSELHMHELRALANHQRALIQW